MPAATRRTLRRPGRDPGPARARRLPAFTAVVLAALLGRSSPASDPAASPAGTGTRPDWTTLSRLPDSWIPSAEGRRITDNLLSHQCALGDWPKNVNTAAHPFAGRPRDQLHGTFDNGATVGEIRFLARVQRVTGNPAAAEAVRRALRHVLAAQYLNGGWPQSFPAGNGYSRHITFNDGTMVNLLKLAREVSTSRDFDFVGEAVRQSARSAFDRGIDCILRCQIRKANRLTVWCAQHDVETLQPRPARSFEPASLSGSESAGILDLLMSIDSPHPALQDAIRSGVAWFAASRLPGIRVETRDGDRVVVEDPASPGLWARFYDLESNRPIFAGRDGVIRHRLADIELERRTGYAWYGSWGEGVARRFVLWEQRLGTAASSSQARDPRP